MPIQLCDVHANYLSYKSEIDEAIQRVVGKASFILGEEVKQFEQEFAAYCGTRYCVGVSNATDGLFLSLMALNIGKDDEVILPTFTVNASIESVLMAGAVPILCDNDEHGLIDPQEIIQKITPQTKAIMCVHMYGAPCDMASIKDVAHKHGLKIIEDCSHAHGAMVGGRRLGTLGDIGVFSFFPSKVLGCFGDGGAVITDNQQYAEKISALRDHGRTREQKYEHEYIGYNMRLDGLQAAVLRAKLPHLDEFVDMRLRIAGKYCDKLPEQLRENVNIDSVYYVFVVRHQERDKIADFLKTHEIQTGLHYPCPLHRMPYYSKMFGEAQFPLAERLCDNVLSLPIYPELSQIQQDEIIKYLYKYFKH